MKKNIFPIIFILCFFALGTYGWLLLRERNHSPEKESSQAEIKEDSAISTLEKDTSSQETITIKEEEEILKDPLNESELQNLYIPISPAECDNKCNSFIEDAKEFTYCQQVCGLKQEDQIHTPENCENKNGLEKDYCLKNLAVSKKSLSDCERISDANVKKTCRNRILEDVLDKQKK